MNWTRSLGVFAFLTTASLAASFATPAAAQPYPGEPYYGGIVPPGEVMRTLTGMGLQPASEPRLRGHVWVVRGIGREGTMVRVVMDSHTGRVVDMRAVNRPVPYGGPYGPDVQPGPYQPDPRYVMRDPYPADPRAYPAPRPGEVYQEQPAYRGPRGAAVPDDDDDDQPVPVPRGYVPHSSVTPPAQPRISSRPEAKPENKRIAAKPPLPKARPDAAETAKKDDGKKADTKQDVAKSDAGKADVKTEAKSEAKTETKSEAKAETKSETKNEETKADTAKADSKAEANKTEAKKEQAATPLTSPKDPETTASIAAAHKKAEAKAKEQAKAEANKADAK